MSVTLYEASIPALIGMLGQLSGLLKKGEEFAGANPNALLEAKLAPDMFALTRQIQIVSDTAKGAAARLAGIDPPKFPDTETSFAELEARIAKTIDFLESVKPGQIDGNEEHAVVLKFPTSTLTMKARDYLFFFVLPNFYFHLTAAYAIMRHKGVTIGKMDYLDASKATITPTAA